MDTWEVTFEDKSINETMSERSGGRTTNVGKVERIASTIGGGALIGYALLNRSKFNTALGVLGAALAYRGATGQCEVYRALGVNTAAEGSEKVARDVHVEKSITIDRSPAELYQFWRNFENLPQFMEGLESVTELGQNRSHWIATGPAGKRVEWDAEIYNEKPNELIAWRSIGDADITNAGSVHFEEAPGGRGTQVKVTLNYNPPGGKAASLFAKLFGSEPGQLVERNLKRLKQFVETGEIPTIQGQTSGRETAGDTDTNRKENKLASKSPEKPLSRAASQEVA